MVELHYSCRLWLNPSVEVGPRVTLAPSRNLFSQTRLEDSRGDGRRPDGRVDAKARVGAAADGWVQGPWLDFCPCFCKSLLLVAGGRKRVAVGNCNEIWSHSPLGHWFKTRSTVTQSSQTRSAW